MKIVAADEAYRVWLEKQLHGAYVKKDYDEKREKMTDSAFVFLRATYWRWAETIAVACPDLNKRPKPPSVLAVGDIHLENFGTWRDDEGRVVWGVNDFDEAAEMPYVLDIMRLATSAVLARPARTPTLRTICDSILDGYEEGLKAPVPFVLDQDNMDMRELFVVDETERQSFWNKVNGYLRKAKSARKRPSKGFLETLAAALPEPPVALTYWQRTAGTGSLGRLRWVGYGVWRGAPLLRECKAIVPSGWTKAHGGRGLPAMNDIAMGKYRSPDPWYHLRGNILVRRLSPNNRKLEIKKRSDATVLLGAEMLKAMGHDLAAIHIGVRDRRKDIHADLRKRGRRWFRTNVRAAAEVVEAEYLEFRKAYLRKKKSRR
jgi:hypothetical protein